MALLLSQAVDKLTDLDRQLLAFEEQRWRHRGARDEAILKTFGWSPWRHQQAVLALIDRPAALVEAPMLVNRLRRRYRRSGGRPIV